MRKKITYLQVLDEIYSTVSSRIISKNNKSYTNKLIGQGNKKIAQKVLEESSELVIDFLKGTKNYLITWFEKKSVCIICFKLNSYI